MSGDTSRLAVSGVVDDLSVATSVDGLLLIAAATSKFIGRWWTGFIAVAARDSTTGNIQLVAESALRTGVAAVAWLPAPGGHPALLLSGSDDGSVDVWRCPEAGETQLRHEHGSIAHDDLARLSLLLHMSLQAPQGLLSGICLPAVLHAASIIPAREQISWSKFIAPMQSSSWCASSVPTETLPKRADRRRQAESLSLPAGQRRCGDANGWLSGCSK